jgi:hypothetical protein
MKKESVASLNRRMALLGATARLQALQAEIDAIGRALPELMPKALANALAAPRKVVRKTAKDGRSNWTAKRRLEHKIRMQKFWAKRRTAKKGAKGEQATAVSAKAKR